MNFVNPSGHALSLPPLAPLAPLPHLPPSQLLPPVLPLPAAPAGAGFSGPARRAPDKAAIALLPEFAPLAANRIMLVQTAQQADAALQVLMACAVVGFDTESKPTFVAGEVSDGPHVVQFSTPATGYVFQLHWPHNREAVAALLAAAGVTKAGFGLDNDRAMLLRKFGVAPQALVDLDHRFHQRGYGKSIGVKSAIALLFGQRFAKSKKTSTANWARAQLTDREVAYAANDAYAAICVAGALQQIDVAEGLLPFTAAQAGHAPVAAKNMPHSEPASSTAQPSSTPRSHGGPNASGAAAHDFSTNSNACGPCPPALAAVQAADPCAYPDPSYTHLKAQLAALHGVDPQRVLLAASASEFIFRITSWIARRGGRQVAMPAHAFGDYAAAAQAWGMDIWRSPSTEVDMSGHDVLRADRDGAGFDFGVDVAVAVAVEVSGGVKGSSETGFSGGGGVQARGQPAQAALVWHCCPSSPTGQPELGLAAALAAMAPPVPHRRRHAPVHVLDLAYAPLRLEPDAQGFTGSTGPASASLLDRVWQLHTPNKALGLTGVRAAYAIAPLHAELAVAQIESFAPSWTVGAHGVALLQAWCTPEVQAWLADSLERLHAWKLRQVALCESLGWRCLPSSANFFCAQMGAGFALAGDRADADVLADTDANANAQIAVAARLAALRTHDIQLRDAASFGLPGWVRLAVLRPVSQDALARAWHASANPYEVGSTNHPVQVHAAGYATDSTTGSAA